MDEQTQDPQPQTEAKPQIYWQAHLEDGTTISESESTWDALKASGKAEKITALTLCTPAGNATLTAGLPGILFPFSNHLGIGIARIENSAGQCVCALWDGNKLEPEIYFQDSELSAA